MLLLPITVHAGDKLAKRFMKIDKLSTASGTTSDMDRPYRFGYGILDTNLNGKVDAGEKLLLLSYCQPVARWVAAEMDSAERGFTHLHRSP